MCRFWVKQCEGGWWLCGVSRYIDKPFGWSFGEHQRRKGRLCGAHQSGSGCSAQVSLRRARVTAMPKLWSPSTGMLVEKKNSKGISKWQSQRFLPTYFDVCSWPWACETLDWLLRVFPQHNDPRTYPLGFGLRYLAVFEDLKARKNKLKKTYKARSV